MTIGTPVPDDSPNLFGFYSYFKKIVILTKLAINN